MTKRVLCLASGVLPEHTPETAIHAASRAGFPAAGVWIEPDLWTDARARDIRHRAEDSGVMLLDAEVFWIKPGRLDPALLRAADLAALLGVPNILVVSSDPDPAATADKFGALCDHVAPAGIAASLEFGAFTDVRAIDDALGIIRRAARPNARLLVDPIHLSRSHGTPEAVASVPPGLVAYAQFCDAGPVAPAMDDFDAILTEAIDGRLLPGEGALPLGALLDAWPPDLPLSIELRSKALRETYPEPTERARRVLDATQLFLDRHAGNAGERP